MKKIAVFIILAFILCFCVCSPKETLRIVTITDTHFTGNEYFDYKGPSPFQMVNQN